ncbi:transposase [Nesterenkonia sphaerica]|uniref:Transposase n=1 Tax=Nesterenkonia sphaerica TaxID=1804988 RepID=A0A5R9A0G8_9MICC|nr:transposase [Nesterenkonia sphaerica]TLP72010.1 transposase [Nesterenkonia sphaerica]
MTLMITETAEMTPQSSTTPAGSEAGPRALHAKRRSYPVEFKRRVVAQYQATPVGQKGALVRAEGLYESTVQRWCRELEAGTLGGMSTPKNPRAKRSPEQQRIAELERQVTKLEAEAVKKDKTIAKREEALEVLGKGVAFLEALSKNKGDQQ